MRTKVLTEIVCFLSSIPCFYSVGSVYWVFGCVGSWTVSMRFELGKCVGVCCMVDVANRSFAFFVLFLLLHFQAGKFCGSWQSCSNLFIFSFI